MVPGRGRDLLPRHQLPTDELAVLDVESSGLLGFCDYLAGYTRSDAFTQLASQTRALDDALATVRYSVHIKGNRVRINRYEDEADYSEEVERTFAKFQQGAVQDYRAKLPNWLDMNHVEAQVLDLVAQLHPDGFGTLDEFCARHREYLDPTVGAFDREVQFYVAYLDYIERFEPAGLPFCYPQVSSESKEIHALQAYDIALANKLVTGSAPVVCNDFSLKGPERLLVVTGPNQGGKTTFARMFGQLHYLAQPGLPHTGPGGGPVPARPDLHALRKGRGSSDAQRQAGGRAAPGPRDPPAGEPRRAQAPPR